MRSTLLQIALILTSLTYVSCHQPRRRQSKDPNVRLLGTLKSYMNASVNPCLDFYQYACGNWEHVHRDINKYVDTIGSLDYIINQRMKFILQRRKFTAKCEKNEIYRKVRSYFQSCEEQKNFDAKYYLHGLKPLDGVEWPQDGEHWRPGDNWNVWSTLGRLQAAGFNGFPLRLDLKHRNATHFYLELKQLDNLGYTAYEQSLIDPWEGSVNRYFRKLAKNVHEFLSNLAKLHKKHGEPWMQEMSINDLIEKVQNVDFLSYFLEFLDFEEDDLRRLNIKVTNLDYFRQLGDLMELTSQDALIHSIKVKFLGYLEKQMPKVDYQLYCLQHMRDLVPLALDYVYEEEVYHLQRNTTDLIIKKVFHQIQQTFLQIIQSHSQEFSLREIAFLQEKILKMKLNIGNLPCVQEKQFYFDYFESWYVSEGNFYRNHINALLHYFGEKYKLLQLQSYSPRHTFFTWPYGSPAFQPTENLIIIPHAYLRFPIFHPEFHDLFLYAELGNTLGHEIMHAFDLNGLQYDGEGNPSSMLTSNLPDKVDFLNSLQCLNQQRPTSLNEKIADISGFRLAFDSYFQRLEEASEFRGRTELSSKQLFFIKFAQFFCAISPKQVSYEDTHDTPYRRVPQVVANHEEFEKVFGCSSQQHLAKVEKCNLW